MCNVSWSTTLWSPADWICRAGVATKSWAFKAELKVDESMKKGLNKAELDFEGLDTFAEVHLVSLDTLSSRHVEWQGDPSRGEPFPHPYCTSSKLSPADGQVVVSLDDLMPTNELLIIFRPPQPVAQAVAAKYGPVCAPSLSFAPHS